MPWIKEDLAAYHAMPVSTRFIVAGTAFMFTASVVLFLSLSSGAKLDGGLATLLGATIGLCMIAWQTNKGFANLIRSQEHRATLEREARVHQAELDVEKLANQGEA